MKGLRSAVALGAVVVFLLVPEVLLAAVGWCGNAWPCSGSNHPSNADIAIYIQAWKDGVTNQPGRGSGLGARLFYKTLSASQYDSVVMSYGSDVGNNDEYTAVIPQSALVPGGQMLYYCTYYDSTDGSTCAGQDQGGCHGGTPQDPPFTLNITGATRIEVTVIFTLCMSETLSDPGNVCVTGSQTVLTNWGSGVQMTKLACGEGEPRRHQYRVEVIFPAGSNPSVTYKYRKSDCADWEPDPNNNLTIDDSGSTQVLPAEGWGSDPPLCCTVDVKPQTWGRIKAIYR